MKQILKIGGMIGIIISKGDTKMIECYKSECPFHCKDEPFCTLYKCEECPDCENLECICDE